MNILVTGSAGFIGSHTTDLLLAQGHQILGVDNFRTGHRANLSDALLHDRFQFVESDVAQEGVLLDLARRHEVECIIHLAALVNVQDSIRDPDSNFRHNVQATHQVAEAARGSQVSRVVFASSAAVYGDSAELPLEEPSTKCPISPYGGAKLASENLLLSHGATFGFGVRCQRYFNVYGPRQDPASPYSGVISIFHRLFRQRKPVQIYGSGDQTRDFISVHDVAWANLIAATRIDMASGVANICTGRAVSLLEIAAIFRRHHPSAPDAVHQPARSGDIVHSRGAPDRMHRDLGFKAERRVEEGLVELMAD